MWYRQSELSRNITVSFAIIYFRECPSAVSLHSCENVGRLKNSFNRPATRLGIMYRDHPQLHRAVVVEFVQKCGRASCSERVSEIRKLWCATTTGPIGDALALESMYLPMYLVLHNKRNVAMHMLAYVIIWLVNFLGRVGRWQRGACSNWKEETSTNWRTCAKKLIPDSLA